MWKCKVCEEKDLRIGELKHQIETLHKLVFPANTAKHISTIELERDRLLSGSDEAIQVIEDEASSILMGSYDLSQVELE